MFIDTLLKISAAQALTATALSTSSIDGGSEIRQLGAGEPMGFALTTDVAADHTTGDETYQVDLVEADDAALTTNLVVIESRILLFSELTAGAKHWIPMPVGRPKRRFFGLRYTLGGTTPTWTATAEFMPQSMFSIDPKHYAKNYVV